MQTLNIAVILGPAFSGIDLKAQLVDNTGVNVGVPVTDGFSLIGDGDYLFHYEEYPDNFTGAVKFLKQDNTYLACAAINPVDFFRGANLDTLINASILHSGILTNASGVTVNLDSEASSQNGFYNESWIVFTDGPGAGQIRPIVG